ncbi:MAG: PQQ-dependent sugar dehydrogenase [Xanthobacteraceae bacterium]|jgi:glucose/arabinose dehydrogenase
MQYNVCIVVAAIAVLWEINSAATAQQRSSTEQPIAANPASNPDQELGRRFIIKAENLPPPKSGPVAASRSLVIPYAGQAPRVMEGFTATPFITGLEHPRRLLVLPNNDVIVAEQRTGYLTLLRDQDGDGKADYIQRYADDFKAPYGLAYREGFVLVADQEGIWRVPHVSGAVRAGRADQPKITDVPPEQRKSVPAAYGQEMITQKGVFGVVAGHQNRHLAIDPKTGALFVGVGSAGNIGVEPEVKASIQRFEADGSNQTTFASGMRNPTTLAFHPTTGELYVGVQERDGLGDNLPPDYLTRVEKGAFYGWPYAYIGPNPQPGFAHRAPEKVKAAIVPDVLFQPHSSVLDLVFYDGEQFPAEYRGDAFVALKGSWNRSEPTGYKVVRVRFKDGRPEGSYENFVTGFWVSGQHRAEVWGRPAALAVMKDGSLLIADDTGGTIWRLSYTGPKDRASDRETTTGATQR